MFLKLIVCKFRPQTAAEGFDAKNIASDINTGNDVKFWHYHAIKDKHENCNTGQKSSLTEQSPVIRKLSLLASVLKTWRNSELMDLIIFDIAFKFVSTPAYGADFSQYLTYRLAMMPYGVSSD